MKDLEKKKEEEKKLLVEVWRVCRKIQSSICKYGYNLWDKFKPLDPDNLGLISESKFINILWQLKTCMGISEYEIREVTDYFKQPDGRIAYCQFCKVVCEEGVDFSKNHDLVTGLEWNDPMHTNVLSNIEKRRLCLLLTKIAQSVRLRDIVLLPYFQDYELVARNTGVVTIAHFSRVLHFLGIVLSSNDFLLLVKRYVKDSYSVNYVAFVKHLEQIIRYFDEHRIIDNSEDFIHNFPGRLIDVELPKLPRPEIGTVRISDVFGLETSFHSVLKPRPCTRECDEILLRIQRHIFENRIRIHDFFDCFDQLRTGFVTKNQFLRILDSIGISGLHRLFLTAEELDILSDRYAESIDPNRINWHIFEDEIDRVFTEKQLEKKPFKIVSCPPLNVAELPRSEKANWQNQRIEDRNLCEEALEKVKAKISKRRLNIRPFFQSFDKVNIGHVTRSQSRQVILSQGILLSNEEFYALERRFNDDLGFNYTQFMEEADPRDYALPKFEEYKKRLLLVNAPRPEPPPETDELDIAIVLAKIKKQMVEKRLRLIEFFRDYDRLRHWNISDTNFRRAFNNSSIKLSSAEVDLICKVFKSPLRDHCVNYKFFCDAVEEVFYQGSLERAPLIVPLQHIPTEDCRYNCLNYDERNLVTKALQKLSKKSDIISNLSSIFEDYDCSNCGTVTVNNFLRALSVRGLHVLLSNREFDVLCKCFAKEKGVQREVNYRAFMRVLDILAANAPKLPI